MPDFDVSFLFWIFVSVIGDPVVNVKMDRMVYFVQNLYSYVFQHCPAAGMQNGDEASPTNIFAGRALLVKMLITLEPHGIFCSNCVYICILTLSNNWYAKW